MAQPYAVIPSHFNPTVYEAIEAADNVLFFQWDLTADTFQLREHRHEHRYALPPRFSRASTKLTLEGMIHPDDYRRISASITDQIKENQSDLDFVQYRIIRKDGEVRWLNEYGHYMKYDEQNSFYYVFISDITDKFGRKEKQRPYNVKRKRFTQQNIRYGKKCPRQGKRFPSAG